MSPPVRISTVEPAENSENRCKILVVDDHPVIAQLLADFLNQQPALRVVGIAHDPTAAHTAAAAHRPDLVILDMGLPEVAKGLLLLHRLRSDLPQTRILIFSAIAAVRVVQESIEIGAHGFLEKTAPLPEVLVAVNEVRSGGTYLGAKASELLREVVRGGVRQAHLPVRDLAILKQLSLGAVAKEIANSQQVSTSMIYKVLSSLRQRFGAKTNEDLVIMAMRRGWLEFEALPNRSRADGSQNHEPA